MTDIADLQERELRFIEASDRERLSMLASGQFAPTERIMPLAVQTLARAFLNRELGAPVSAALPYKK